MVFACSLTGLKIPMSIANNHHSSQFSFIIGTLAGRCHSGQLESDAGPGLEQSQKRSRHRIVTRVERRKRRREVREPTVE